MKTALLALTLLAGAVQATSLTASVVAIGELVAADGSPAGSYALSCDSPTCFASSFTGLPTSLSASYTDADNRFSGSGFAEVPSALLMRARADLQLSGEAFGGSKAHHWRVQSVARVETEMVLDPAIPADLGRPVNLQLRYRFEGTRSMLFVNMSAAAHAEVRSASGPFAQRIFCVTDPADPGFCTTQSLAVTYGAVFPFETALTATTLALVQPDRSDGHWAELNVDYSHTLELVGAFVTPLDDRPVGGWGLSLADEDLLLFTSPVPEPASGVLAAFGLAALVLRLRGSHRPCAPAPAKLRS